MRRLMFEQEGCQKTGAGRRTGAQTPEHEHATVTGGHRSTLVSLLLKTASAPELWFLFWRWAVGVLGWWRWLGLGGSDPLRLLRRALVVSLLGERTGRHCAYDYQDKQLSN